MDRRAIARMRNGWRAVEVAEDAPTGIKALPTLDCLKLNCEKVMRMIDALPPELRAMVHQYDWQTVAQHHPAAVKAAWWKAAEDNWGRGEHG